MARLSTPQRSLIAYAAFALVFVTICFTFGPTRSFGYGIFWDAHVYSKAIGVFLAGGDPYARTSPQLLFVSPPIFLLCASYLSKLFPGHTGWYIYTTTVVFSTLAIPYLLAHFYLRSTWMTPLVAIAIFTFQPRFIVERSMASGNIVLPIYALALLAGADGLRRNRWLWFYVVIIIASIVKPMLLGLLLLPLLAGTRQLWRSAFAFTAVFAIYAAQRLLTPTLYAGFTGAAYEQVIGRHDYGIGLVHRLYKLGDRFPRLQNVELLSAIHFALAGIILAAIVWQWRNKAGESVPKLWIPALLVMGIIANPRMEDYDSCIAIIPTIYICVEFLRHLQLKQNGAAAIAIAMTGIMVAFTTDYEIALCLLFVGVILLTLFQVNENHTLRIVAQDDSLAEIQVVQ